MLKNERYTGVYIFKDIIREENEIPAIVDKELFRRVQEVIERNWRMPPQPLDLFRLYSDREIALWPVRISNGRC